MYKNVIFDLGKVLLNFEPEEYLRSKIRQNDKVLELYKQIFQSEEWLMLDKGTITEEEAINILAQRNSENAKLIKLAFNNWYEILTPKEETVEVLKDLKKANYRVYFLSNFHLLAFEYIIKTYDFFKLFDGGIVSYKEKLLKPEEKIYKRIIEEYGLKPQESIFVDDVQANVESARKLDFEGIVFKNASDLREDLKKLHVGI